MSQVQRNSLAEARKVVLETMQPVVEEMTIEEVAELLPKYERLAWWIAGVTVQDGDPERPERLS